MIKSTEFTPRRKETHMENEKNLGGSLPQKRKFTDHLLVLYAGTVALLLLGQILGSFLVLPLMFVKKNTAFWVAMATYLMFAGAWILLLLYLRLSKKNRPILRTLGSEPAGNRGKFLLLGLGLGFGLNGVCILAAWLHGDISLTLSHPSLGGMALLFAAVFLQSALEEAACRGFLYQRLRRSYRRAWVAIFGNSLLFALLHLTNPGVNALSVVNIFVIGVFFSLMVCYLDSLWCAMAVHAAWNYTQNILFGLPNSGIAATYSLFRLDSAARNSFAYNRAFGIEGTVFADLVIIAACVGLYLWGRKHGKEPLDIWTREPSPVEEN